MNVKTRLDRMRRANWLRIEKSYVEPEDPNACPDCVAGVRYIREANAAGQVVFSYHIRCKTCGGTGVRVA